MRDTLHRRGTRPDDANPLVGQPVETAIRPAAGIVIIPAAGVEGVALEVSNAWNARQFRTVQRPV